MLLRWLKSELITQPARKLFGRIGSEWTSAVQGALPAVCWEIFPMFDKPTIGDTSKRAECHVVRRFGVRQLDALRILRDGARRPQIEK